MKKILIFGTFLGLLACTTAMSAVRDGTPVRAKSGTTSTQTRTSNPIRSGGDGTRNTAARVVSTRTTTGAITTRAGTMRVDSSTRAATTRPITKVLRSNTGPGRNAPRTGATISRTGTTNATTMAETRTGAAYNKCKTAYFQCMDQFCQLKDDDYRRCSCSARIHDLKSVRTNIADTNTKLTEFTENLDVVGMTAAQATAMHTASDGENALAADTSASKALLDAIMKSIRGQDSTVSGKLSDLNSINLAFDTSNAFGVTDAAQVIASYNGTELYNAVYPSCRSAVANDCTDATLQRAITAYLMAIEQDCNTVQTALENKQKELKGAIREGGAMLDLARIENRHKHNSDNLAACINNIESAILSEEVCGANYHKCLDNGEFIDVTTGAPISGVVKFYELGNLLKFDMGKNATDQQLSKISNNQKFVKNFEAKTKKFARDAMDKCVEIADTAWAEYLDRALLAIYYAQQAKVETIKNGCFDLISACYEDKDAAITAAMSALVGTDSAISLMPDKIVLTQQMCGDYIRSCNNMFNDDENNRNIIAEYITKQTDKDRLDACRAIVRQCFTNYGGANYENFYYPSSGLFVTRYVDGPAYDGDNNPIDRGAAKTALDWFTLYRYDVNGHRQVDPETQEPIYVSECAKQVASVQSCSDLVEESFGGMDNIIAKQGTLAEYGTYIYEKPSDTLDLDKNAFAYGWAKADELDAGASIWTDTSLGTEYKFQNRRLRPNGVATEVYNNIIDDLGTQCMNLQGKFIEPQFIDHNVFNNIMNHPDFNSVGANACMIKAPGCEPDPANNIPRYCYGFAYAISLGGFVYENICPKDYMLYTDTTAWGICSCWENGGRRSKGGLTTKCMPTIPVTENAKDDLCIKNGVAQYQYYTGSINSIDVSVDTWCTAPLNDNNQVCPISGCDSIPDNIPPGIGNPT